MTFRSINHSSPVSVDIKLEDLPPNWSLPHEFERPTPPPYDDSSLRAAVEHLHGEIFHLQEKIGELHKLAFNKEMVEGVLTAYLEKAVERIEERPIPVIRLPEKPFDRTLQIAALISSSSLLTITVLLMLELLHQHN